MKKHVEPVIDFLVNVTEGLTALMALIMLISLFWQVFTRFVLKVPSIWTEEVARYSFIFMALLGAAVGVRNSTHFGMNLFTDKLKGKVYEYYMKYFVNGVIFASSLLIIFYGYHFTISYGLRRVSPTFLFPMSWVFMIIPISGLLMAIFSLYNILFQEYKDEKHQ